MVKEYIQFAIDNGYVSLTATHRDLIIAITSKEFIEAIAR